MTAPLYDYMDTPDALLALRADYDALAARLAELVSACNFRDAAVISGRMDMLQAATERYSKALLRAKDSAEPRETV